MSGLEIMLIIFGATALLGLCIVLPLVIYSKNYHKAPLETQWKISDKELLLLFDEQIDGYLTVKTLVSLTKLTESEAKKRLHNLSYTQTITSRYTSWGNTHFTLKEKNDLRPSPKLSSNPFITTEDLFLLFKHHNYELTLQKICLNTGLPINVIVKEMKRFIKEKIVVKLVDRWFNSSYVLSEPYRSRGIEEVKNEDFLDLDLSKIYKKEMK
ncbi:MAG: hypothetical protein KJN84_04760 [Bacteroidia bacterium]|nr:hypothetical protein [Bacteroidia bacterium]